MQIIAFIGQNAPWSWIIAGLVLLALELVLPGGYLLWMGIAGILTGILVLVQPLDWPVQWLIFGVLSLISILIWVRVTRQRGVQTDRPLLNQRAEQLIGREAILDRPIVSGFGRLALGDTIWRVAGPDLPAGQQVRVVAAEGTMLRVEAVEDRPARVH